MRYVRYPIVMLLFHLYTTSGLCSDSGSKFNDSTFINNQINKVRYFSLSISNDAYHKTDWYYTGGLQIEYVTSGLHKSPLKKLLITFPNYAVNTYGISLTLDAFTPKDIKQEQVLENDRPYAGYIMAGHFAISNQLFKNRRLTSKLHIGIIGPDAHTKDIQKQIHLMLQCTAPKGWRNQIKRDVIVDYSLKIEKALWQPTHFVELIAQATIRAGTLYNNIGFGGTIRMGKINGYFANVPTFFSSLKPLYLINKFQLYGYLQVNSRLSAYNATLQGGLISKESPFVLRPHQVERVITEWKSGLVCGYENLNLELGQTSLSREFKTGQRHTWGYLTLSVFF